VPSERLQTPCAPDARGAATAGDDTPPAPRRLEVVYYTDPLCAWSWAIEPQWRRLRFEYDEGIAWRYVMGGMVADWGSYQDTLNSVYNPAQMALQWYQVRQLTGTRLDERIWREDPPSSSYPACLAVKAAERQGPAAGEDCLRRLREAVMIGRRNVARGEALVEAAEGLAADPPRGVAFDVDRFREDILGAEVRNAFHEDLREVRYRDIGRFPTLVLRAEGDRAIALAGYRTYEIIREALTRLAPDLRPRRREPDAVAYVSYWGRAAGREVAQAFGIEHEAAARTLDEAVAAGVLARGESSDDYRAPR
jgi:predicted DsbA family dithiol-disulfide isomerase